MGLVSYPMLISFVGLLCYGKIWVFDDNQQEILFWSVIYLSVSAFQILYVFISGGRYWHNFVLILFSIAMIYGLGYPVYYLFVHDFMQIPLSEAAIITSLQLYLIATMSLFSGVLLSDLLNGNPDLGRNILVNHQKYFRLRRFALLLLGMAIILMLVFYYELGYFRGLGHTELLDQKMDEGTVFVPFLPMLLTGAFLFFYSKRNNWSLNEIACVLLIMMAIGYQMTMGNRKIILSIVVCLLASGGIRYGYRIKVRHIAFAALLFGGFCLLHAVRHSIPQLLFHGTLDERIYHMDFQRVLRGGSNIAISFQTLAYNIAYDQTRYYGCTYVKAFLYMIPSFLLSSPKSLSLGHMFKEQAATVRDFAGDRIPGFGYSPVAEAYVNFGFIGIPLMFFLFGLIFRGTQRCLSGRSSIFRAFIGVVLCTRVLTFFRTSFYPWFNLTVKEIIYGSLIIAVTLVVVHSVARGWRHEEGFSRKRRSSEVILT
jgi:oligosaccharide repeat unit polymerase